MARKEHKGGELTNEELLKDQTIKNSNQGGGYNGSQDTGDKAIRQLGTDVQKADGFGKKESGKAE